MIETGIDVFTYASICGALILMLIIGGAVGWHLGMLSSVVMRLNAIERLLLRAERRQRRRRAKWTKK